jgi:type IV secretory pathway VirJ component
MSARRLLIVIALFSQAVLAVPSAAATRPAGPPREQDQAGIPAVRDLPLVEVQSAYGSRDILGVLVTGDGGWALPDRGLSQDLSNSGIPVVGLNALKYFWKPKSPDEAGADLTRILRHYLASWHKDRAVLVGYSLGADTLPFMTTRLPEDLQARVAMIVLLGPSASAEFEFHILDWIGAGPQKNALPTIPEIAKIPDHVKILCVYGEGDKDQICTTLDPHRVHCMQLPGGHRLKSGYGPVAAVIVDSLK